MNTDPLPIPDQPGGVLDPTTAGSPYSRAITAPWVIRPPTSVTSAGGHVVTSVRPGDAFVVRREHPGWRERLI